MDIMLQKCKKAEIFLGSHTTVYDSIMFFFFIPRELIFGDNNDSAWCKM